MSCITTIIIWTTSCDTGDAIEFRGLVNETLSALGQPPFEDRFVEQTGGGKIAEPLLYGGFNHLPVEEFMEQIGHCCSNVEWTSGSVGNFMIVSTEGSDPRFFVDLIEQTLSPLPTWPEDQE